MKAYSYIRFSSEKQKFGHSLQRQMELAVNWCKNNHIELSTDSYQDLGVSAFKGLNASDGNLGLFLQAVKIGSIPSNSYLLCENLDRLSRQSILTALNTLTSILSTGITVVTLADDKTYTKESLNNLPDLMMSLLIMSRANDESLTKSKRVKAAWDKKKLEAKTIGKPITKNCPKWLKIENGIYQPIPEYVAVITRIYQMCIQGNGIHIITKTLNQNEVPTFNGILNGWYPSYIQNILCTKKVLGQYVGNSETIENYYPKVISDELWHEAQSAMSSRQTFGGKRGKTINIVQGLTLCRRCKGKIIKFRNDLQGGRFYCYNNVRGIKKCKGHMKYDDVIEKVLKNVTELNISSLLNNDIDIENGILKEKQIEQNKEKDLENQLKTLAEALLIGNLYTIVDKIKSVEEELTKVKKLLSILDAQYKDVVAHKKTIENDIQNIREIMGNLTEENKLKIQTGLRRLITEIHLDLQRDGVTILYKNSKVIKAEHGFTLKTMLSDDH